MSAVPSALVLGVGCSSDATADDARAAVDQALSAHGLAGTAVAAIATVDRRADHPALLALASAGTPMHAFGPAELAAVAVPNPSALVAEHLGTPSVCEAAALLAAGSGAQLVITKVRTERVTVAAAVRPSHPAAPDPQPHLGKEQYR